MYNKINEIRGLCKFFRKDVLKISVREMEKITGLKGCNIYSFEHGSTSKLIYLVGYYELLKNDVINETKFTTQLNKILEG